MSALSFGNSRNAALFRDNGTGMDFAALIPPFYIAAAALGALGQSLRGALGLMKTYREVGKFGFDRVFFLASVMLGAMSGLLGALVYDLPGTSPGALSFEDLSNDRNFILMGIAAGYFGADVIEGVLGRYAPGKP